MIGIVVLFGILMLLFIYWSIYVLPKRVSPTDKAVEWIRNNWRNYVYQDGDGIIHFGHWESDFRKYMKDYD